MHSANTAQSNTDKILNASTQSLLLKLTFHLPQMNSGMNALGGWRQRETLRRNGVQTTLSSDVSVFNSQVCAEFLDLLVIGTISVDLITSAGFTKMKGNVL